MKQEELLINRLAAYAGSDMYPFHMPGHKRTPGTMDSFANPWTVDITVSYTHLTLPTIA